MKYFERFINESEWTRMNKNERIRMNEEEGSKEELIKYFGWRRRGYIMAIIVVLKTVG